MYKERLYYDNFGVSGNGVSAAVIPANNYRKVLILGTASTGNVTWSTRKNQANQADGIVLQTGIPFKMCIEEFGQAVTQAWYCMSTAGVNVGWGEVVEIEVPGGVPMQDRPADQIPAQVPTPAPGYFDHGGPHPPKRDAIAIPRAFPTGPDEVESIERLDTLGGRPDLHHHEGMTWHNQNKP